MLFGFFFRKKKQKAEVNLPPVEIVQAPSGPSAPGTHIAYNPELVPELEAEHRTLLEIFTKLMHAYAVGDLATASSQLADFRGHLLAHLVKENIRLYIYLEHALATDPDRHTTVHRFHHEMTGIGKAVLNILDKYAAIADNPSLAASFGTDMTNLGDALKQRILDEEEKLYPLYQPLK